MKFIILVSVLICLFTIVLFKHFEKKTANFGMRCLNELVGFFVGFVLMGLFQLQFLGEDAATAAAAHKITSEYLLKLSVFFYIAYKFLSYKKKREITEEKVSTFHYIIAFLSFIPLIGILIGFITTIFGFFTKRKGGGRVAVIGVSGIVFMFFLKDFGILKVLDQSQATTFFDAIEKTDSSTVIELNYTVEFLESFKEQTGRYPTVIANNNTKSTYYELVDPEHYYLLSPGKDKIPFTADDIIPSIKSNMKKKTGLLIKPDEKNL